MSLLLQNKRKESKPNQGLSGGNAWIKDVAPCREIAVAKGCKGEAGIACDVSADGEAADALEDDQFVGALGAAIYAFRRGWLRGGDGRMGRGGLALRGLILGWIGLRGRRNLGGGEGAQTFLHTSDGELAHDRSDDPRDAALDEEVVGFLVENGGSKDEEFEQEAIVGERSGEGEDPPFLEGDRSWGDVEVEAYLVAGGFVLGLFEQDLADAEGDTWQAALVGDLGEAFSGGESEGIARERAEQSSPCSEQKEDLDFLELSRCTTIDALSANVDGISIRGRAQDRVTV